MNRIGRDLTIWRADDARQQGRSGPGVREMPARDDGVLFEW